MACFPSCSRAQEILRIGLASASILFAFGCEIENQSGPTDSREKTESPSEATTPVSYSITPQGRQWLELAMDNSQLVFSGLPGDPLQYGADFERVSTFQTIELSLSSVVTQYQFAAYDSNDVSLFTGWVTYHADRHPTPFPPEFFNEDDPIYDEFDATPVDQFDLNEASLSGLALSVQDKNGTSLFDSGTQAVGMWKGRDGPPELVARFHVAMWIAQVAVHDLEYSQAPPGMKPRDARRLDGPAPNSPPEPRPGPLPELDPTPTRVIRLDPAGGGVPAGQGNYRFDCCRGHLIPGSDPRQYYGTPRPRPRTWPWAQPAGPTWFGVSTGEERCGQTAVANHFTYWKKDVHPKHVIDDYWWTCADATWGTRPGTLAACLKKIAGDEGLTAGFADRAIGNSNPTDTELRDFLKFLADERAAILLVNEGQKLNDYHWMNLVGYGTREGKFHVVVMDGNYERACDEDRGKGEGEEKGKSGICFHVWEWTSFEPAWKYNLPGYKPYLFVRPDQKPPDWVAMVVKDPPKVPKGGAHTPAASPP